MHWIHIGKQLSLDVSIPIGAQEYWLQLDERNIDDPDAMMNNKVARVHNLFHFSFISSYVHMLYLSFAVGDTNGDSSIPWNGRKRERTAIVT